MSEVGPGNLLEPSDAVNRAKEGQGVPHPDTDPLNPKGIALVNGIQEGGSDSPYKPLPDTLTQAARDALEAAGYTTLERARAASDDELLALDGVGPATVKAIRDAS